MRNIFILLVLSLSGGVSAAEVSAVEIPISIFGVQLGGRIGVVKTCPLDSMKSKVNCWVGEPNKHRDGGRSGMIHLTNSDGRPKWAAFATFEAEVSPKGILERLVTRIHGSDQIAEIHSAIVGRFGVPTRSASRTVSSYSVEWIRKDISVRMLCAIGEFCMIDTASPAWWADYQRQLEDRRRKDAARPVTL